MRRMSKGMMYAFHNKHRGALHVAPEVQDSWSEVCRVFQRTIFLMRCCSRDSMQPAHM